MHTLLLIFWWIFVVGYVLSDLRITYSVEKSWPKTLGWIAVRTATFIFMSYQLSRA